MKSRNSFTLLSPVPSPARRLALGLLPVISLSVLAICFGDDQKKDTTQEATKSVWARKMEHAQKLLAAVAQDDATLVERNANELIKISNELAWKKLRSERYEELSKEYRKEAEALIKSAQQKNKEGMALGYVKLSLACFNCHNHVREVKVANP